MSQRAARRAAGEDGRSRASLGLGLVRLVHPFPSLLDATMTAVLALLVGASVGLAVRLAAGMLGLQFAIGASNDLLDQASDRRAVRPKPLVVGSVSPGAAVTVFGAAVAIGLALAASAGPLALAVGLLGLAVGLVYNVWLKRTPLAWLAFAAGVGLLPAYAWAGASGCPTSSFYGLIGLAVLGGAALALGNSLADVDADRLAGAPSVAVQLGVGRTLAADAGFLLVAEVAALVWALGASGTSQPLFLAVQLAGSALGWAGVGATAGSSLRPHGWELQAVGLGLAGAGLVGSLLAAGLLRAGGC